MKYFNFTIPLDFGCLGEKEVVVEYSIEEGDYKPYLDHLYFADDNNMCYDLMIDMEEKELDAIYEIARQHRIEYLSGGEP